MENRNIVLCSSTKDFLWKINLQGDYVRKSFVDLVSHLLIGVKGSVAEAGVYQGEFAQTINKVFFDRQFFLFDTFTGFDERDTTIDNEKKYSSVRPGHFPLTNIDLVKEKMSFPEQCIFKKGYFPETAEGIDEKFVFVSIDMDLYQPTIEALNYFFFRLTSPGYIMIHDFNCKRYKGVNVAVIEFTQKNNLTIVPIGDSSGSVILIK